MENDSKLLIFIKKSSFPLSVFIFFFLVVALVLNFLVNVVVSYYKSYFVDGTLFNPKPIQFSSDLIFDFTYLFYYSLFLLIVALISFVVSVYLTYKVHSNFGSINKKQKGKARFTTLKELKKQYRAVPEKEERYKGSGGVPVSRYKDKIFIDDSAVNNLVIGTTRSGKGETFIFPTIDIYSRAERQPSMIINDPKGELFAASKDTLENLGYHVEVLNLMNPFQSMSYNLLELVKHEYFEGNYSMAQQYARSLSFMIYNDPTAKDKYWQDASTALCTALILALCEKCRHEPEKITMYNVALMMNVMATEMDEEENGNTKLDEFFNQFPPSHPARLQYLTINFARGQTKASVLSNTTSKLSIFTLDGIAKLTSKNSIDMKKFGFGHWIKGKAKPLSKVKIFFPNEKKETVKTDSNGVFAIYHNHHLEIGEEIRIFVDNKKSVFTIEGWNKDTGELFVRGQNNDNNVELTSVMQFEKPIALFMIVPDYDHTFNIIASLFVKQLYTELARTASIVRGGKCFREVVFILDEFGNMPPIDDMATILTVCLGRNIRFNLIIQAYSQLKKNYGDDWETIDGNTNNTFYILTDDENTAKRISQKLGDRTTIIKSRSGKTFSLDKTKSESVEAIPLLTHDELMRLKEGEVVVIRTIKRQDLKRKRIKQFPIFNTGKTSMKYRWEYLSDYYDPNKSINDYEIPCEHEDVNLADIRPGFLGLDDEIGWLANHSEKTNTEDILDVSNSIKSIMDRKPPILKEEKLSESEKQQELIQENVVSEDIEHDDFPLVATGIGQNNLSEFENEHAKEEQREKNGLPVMLFKQAVYKGTFEEIFGDDFEHLPCEKVKELLIIYKDNFRQELFVKLQTFVEEKLKNKIGKGD